MRGIFTMHWYLWLRWFAEAPALRYSHLNAALAVKHRIGFGLRFARKSKPFCFSALAQFSTSV